ncbi:MAG: phosphoenolpyruvate--protein phosphotransferase [Gammaproteobacteria bacterium]|nr:MAG: phosphoenolpyruvate--protein phosphotransferase [Gammaproteobacteria bacterium]
MALVLHGEGVARGVTLGRVHVLGRCRGHALEEGLPRRRLAEEQARYRAAHAAARERLRAARERAPAHFPLDAVALLELHLLMVDDAAFARRPLELILERRCNAEAALHRQCEELRRAFGEVADPYLRARGEEVLLVGQAILRELDRLRPAGGPGAGEAPRLRRRVVLARELSPADALLLYRQGAAAVVVEQGSAASHAAVLARGLGIPAVLGVRGASRYARPGEQAVVDGGLGVLVLDPDAEALAHYRRRRASASGRRAALARRSRRPAVTRDGVPVTLLANLERPEEAEAAVARGAEGVGLLRSECLFLAGARPPDEQAQYAAYRQALRALGGRPLTLRTLDLGADRLPAPGGGPAVLRALRPCYRHLDLFRTQLRAALRAAAHGPLRLCFPMVGSLEELARIRQLLEEARAALEAQGLRAGRPPLGIMVEVPAAALLAPAFAARLDFLALGTNDLAQYALAVDRLDEGARELYQPLHPAVLQLVHRTVEAGRAAGIPVTLCGELAAEPRWTRLLLGLGLRRLSLPPAALPEVKAAVQGATLAALEPLARQALAAEEAAQVLELAERLNRQG